MTTPKITCRQAAKAIRESAPTTEWEDLDLARAEILEAFGDQPLPESLLKAYDFSDIVPED